MTLHPNQHVWYITNHGKRREGTATGNWYWTGIEARYELRVDGKLKWIRGPQIQRGEALRCQQEQARCMAEAAHDVGALLGARDWAMERKVIEADK